MVAREKHKRSFADRVIEADQELTHFLLSPEGEAANLPSGSVVVFDDTSDPNLFKEAATLALSIRSRTRSKMELKKPVVVVHIERPEVTIQPTTWEALATEVGWDAPIEGVTKTKPGSKRG